MVSVASNDSVGDARAGTDLVRHGFSKSLGPGLRVGALVPPERQHARADVILQDTSWR